MNMFRANAKIYFFIIVTIYAGKTLCVFSLNLAHTNDFVPKEKFVAAGGGLQFVFGLGAMGGPLVCSIVMDRLDRILTHDVRSGGRKMTFKHTTATEGNYHYYHLIIIIAISLFQHTTIQTWFQRHTRRALFLFLARTGAEAKYRSVSRSSSESWRP